MLVYFLLVSLMSVIKLTYLLIIFRFACSTDSTLPTRLKPVKALSISLHGEKLPDQLTNHRMIISQKLDIAPELLKDCKVVGSMSNIDLRGNKHLQFYFTYNLHPANSTLQINIFARMLNSQQISKDLLIVMDFLIAQFPSDYAIISSNITSFQTHVFYKTTRQYQMIFFLNGFNNFSLSGNISHAYQDAEYVYTIHYMSCDTDSESMGWREGSDYLLYTLMVVPIPNVIQKFRLSDRRFSLDYPKGYEYFYGIKGSIEEQFSGSFSPRYGGITFIAENLHKSKVYGLTFFPYPRQDNFSDERIREPFPFVKVGLYCLLAVSVFVLIFILYKKLYCVRRLLNDPQESYEFQVSETTKTDLKQSDLSRHKYEINTVAEVEEKYESTTKNSYQPEAHQEPSLVFKQ